jgi:ADP-ribose pyrophosphatase YjhB (NUDIX family)
MTDRVLPAGLERLIGADGVVERVRLAAYAWCEQDGAVLLTRISDRGPGGGLWTLPGGGLDFGEDPLDGVVREVAEETGLDLVPGELLGVRSAVLEPAETISGHRIHAVGILYRGRIAGGRLRSEADGSSDLARWVAAVDVAALPQVDLLRWASALLRNA